MDIDLLSKMVKELILDNDEVSLPGVGSFVAELVPSSFSDKGYTINPPYKRLSFRKKADASDNVLIDFYAKSNNVDKETASKIVIDFLSEMQKVLELRKSIVFPGLGKLRATKENIFFFVADEDLDIYPEGFGLEPISLKTHEETPAEVSATIAALQDILNPEETESKSGSEEPSEAGSGPEDAPEVTGGGQPESSLEAEVESDSELQPECRQQLRRLNYSLSRRRQLKSPTSSLRTNLSLGRKTNKRQHRALKAVQMRPMNISQKRCQILKTCLKQPVTNILSQSPHKKRRASPTTLGSLSSRRQLKSPTASPKTNLSLRRKENRRMSRSRNRSLKTNCSLSLRWNQMTRSSHGQSLRKRAGKDGKH